MKKNKLEEIYSFEKLELEKAKIRYNMKYQEELMSLGYDRLAGNFRASVIESAKGIAQSALSEVIVRLIRGR